MHANWQAAHFRGVSSAAVLELRAKFFARDIDHPLQLHGQAHAPLDLQLATHERHLRLHLALGDGHEVFVLHGDGQVRLQWVAGNTMVSAGPLFWPN